VEQIRQSRAHVIFVALGAPKQELFIDRYIRQTNVPIAIGVGGSFEIITGITKRAPRLIQHMGFEWLFRLAQEPRRLWRRYLIGNPEFLWILGKYALVGTESDHEYEVNRHVAEKNLPSYEESPSS
jgi:N-acetylglucosaminyldiphosphoundecaprenol N-acetyl-beta-D-mannosaminyltransferase